MKPSHLADLLKRYLQDSTIEGETWTVDQWYEARDMPRPTPPTPAEQAAAKARAWQRIQARTRPRPVAWRRPAVRWAAAALLVLGLSLAWLGVPHRPAAGLARHPTATTAEQLTVTAEAGGWQRSTNQTGHALLLALADGSTVTLQPGSWLRYPARFAPGHERVVELSGEAFFAVFHDARRRFRVLTPQLETTVLGTSFTVRAVPGQAEATVEVRTGAVRVCPSTASPAVGAAVVVRPNQQVVYSVAAPVLRPVLVAEPALLRPQPLSFEERPVAEVLASLEAGYGVPIRYTGAALAGCTVSLAFGTENLFEKLDLLCKTLGATYERTDEAIIFRSRGCQSE
ncbi:FecR family protein [Hymenobacter antarcticus]|uniref:FecR family protein n=1 Tax=Hymenobacter antarcticus TaxID=486270 RepID=A0ABP7QAG5_9BACT